MPCGEEKFKRGVNFGGKTRFFKFDSKNEKLQAESF